MIKNDKQLKDLIKKPKDELIDFLDDCNLYEIIAFIDYHKMKFKFVEWLHLHDYLLEVIERNLNEGKYEQY